jgi:hypothetical protein
VTGQQLYQIENRTCGTNGHGTGRRAYEAPITVGAVASP